VLARLSEQWVFYSNIWFSAFWLSFPCCVYSCIPSGSWIAGDCSLDAALIHGHLRLWTSGSGWNEVVQVLRSSSNSRGWADLVCCSNLMYILQCDGWIALITCVYTYTAMLGSVFRDIANRWAHSCACHLSWAGNPVSSTGALYYGKIWGSSDHPTL
jgi:hypothetical protein